jgi:hypothetical protein
MPSLSTRQPIGFRGLAALGFALLVGAGCRPAPPPPAAKPPDAPKVVSSEPVSASTRAWRFDFGPPEGPMVLPERFKSNSTARYWATRKFTARVQPGWVGVHMWSEYDSSTGYGWMPDRALDLPYERDNALSPIFHERDTNPIYHVLADGLSTRQGTGFEAVFRVDVPPGDYVLTAYLGDLSAGESRRDQVVKVNGRPLITGVDTAGGEIKAVTRPFRLEQSPLLVSFCVGSGGQIGVSGFEVKVAGPGAAASERAIPSSPPGPETIQKNFDTQVRLDREEAARQFAALAVLGHLGKTLPPMVPRLGATRIFLTMYGDPSRLCDGNPNLDISGMVRLVKEMGVDMVSLRHPTAARQYAEAGVSPMGDVHAEGLHSAKPVDMQVLLKKDGGTAEWKGFFSIHSPSNQAEFRRQHEELIRPMRDVVAGVFVDEPRGMTCNGGALGDYSRWSEVAFREWCRAEAHPEWAAHGLPKPGMNEAFHAFHRFRLDSVALFLMGIYRGSFIARLPLMPGNGELGPSAVNHSTFYPPAIARAGMWAASWNYDEAWQVKRSAEVVKAVEEFGGKSAVFTSLGKDERASRLLGVAALSARPDVLGPREGHSPSLVREFALLARALAEARHECGVYLYWPESLTYPDLVDFTGTEGGRWDEMAKAFFEQNLDFKVSYTARVGPPAILVYATATPVLSDAEVRNLRSFLAGGGTLVYGCAKDPLRVDGTVRGTLEQVFGAEAAAGIVRRPGPPAPSELRKLAAEKGVVVNPQPSRAATVLTWLFSRQQQHLLLVANPGESVAEFAPAGAWVDAFTGEAVSDVKPATLKPGLFRLLVETR